MKVGVSTDWCKEGVKVQVSQIIACPSHHTQTVLNSSSQNRPALPRPLRLGTLLPLDAPSLEAPPLLPEAPDAPTQEEPPYLFLSQMAFPLSLAAGLVFLRRLFSRLLQAVFSLTSGYFPERIGRSEEKGGTREASSTLKWWGSLR